MPVQPPNFLGTPFWAAENHRLVAILRPLLQEAAELGVGIAEEDLVQFEVGFDNALANAEAADWARRHTDALLMQLGTTTRRQVDSIIANWFTTPGGLVGEFIEVPGMTLGDLSIALERVLGYNQSRAQMIARTEMTRATAEGREVSRVAAGLPPTLYKPPAHPRGRCWDSEDLLADGTWVTIWQTRRDEVVCQTPLETPLGEMQGCRDLHGRVISEGPYFGMPIEDARVIAAARAEGQERVTTEQAAAELAGALAEYEIWQADGRSAPVKFDPAQPRDESGKWTSGGAGTRAPESVEREAALLQAEKEIVAQDFETGIIVDQDGNELLRKDGGKSSISWTKDEMAKMEGGILTHNHPTGGSFSMSDVECMVLTKMQGIRAVGYEDGKRYRYIMKPSVQLTLKDWMAFASQFQDVVQQVRLASIGEIRSGKVTTSQAGIRDNHRIWEQFNSALLEQGVDLGYRREEW